MNGNITGMDTLTKIICEELKKNCDLKESYDTKVLCNQCDYLTK